MSINPIEDFIGIFNSSIMLVCSNHQYYEMFYYSRQFSLDPHFH